MDLVALPGELPENVTNHADEELRSTTLAANHHNRIFSTAAVLDSELQSVIHTKFVNFVNGRDARFYAAETGGAALHSHISTDPKYGYVQGTHAFARGGPVLIKACIFKKNLGWQAWLQHRVREAMTHAKVSAVSERCPHVAQFLFAGLHPETGVY